MAVTIKSQREIDLMRESGHILYKVHEELGQAIEPGMSTLDIDRLGEKLIRGYGCIPNFLHYMDILHLYVYLLIMKLCMVYQGQTEYCRKAILSVWMQVLFIKDIILMLQELMA